MNQPDLDRPIRFDATFVANRYIISASVMYPKIPNPRRKEQLEKFDKLLSDLEHQMVLLRLAILNSQYLKRDPTAIDELYVYPPQMVRQIADAIYENCEPKKKTYDLVLKFTVCIGPDAPDESSVVISLNPRDNRNTWPKQHTVLFKRLSPKLMGGIELIQNHPRIRNSRWYAFSLQSFYHPSRVDWSAIPDSFLSKDSGEGQKKILARMNESWCDPQDLLSHYLQYIDQVVSSSTIAEYKDYIDTHYLPKLLSEDDIRSQWSRVRNQLKKQLFESLKKFAKEPKDRYKPEIGAQLGIIVHPPDLAQFDQNGFFVFELLEVLWYEKSERPEARTIFSTGKFFEEPLFIPSIPESEVRH